MCRTEHVPAIVRSLAGRSRLGRRGFGEGGKEEAAFSTHRGEKSFRDFASDGATWGRKGLGRRRRTLGG